MRTLWIGLFVVGCGRPDAPEPAEPPVPERGEPAASEAEEPDADDVTEAPAAEEPAVTEPPAFAARREPLPEPVRAEMTGVSWHEGCPVGLDDLALLHIPHWGFDGRVHEGELVVASDVADELLGVFEALYDARFPIERMQRVDAYGGSDDRSMAANNSSAFNCRRIMGTDTWSNHSYGRALDLNPVQNPYIVNGKAYPPASSAYVDRDQQAPGMIHDGDAVVRAFADAGWSWGGHWSRVKDYQHFERR